MAIFEVGCKTNQGLHLVAIPFFLKLDEMEA
jgi:hypothetical protein